jgi:hypothetical protein
MANIDATTPQLKLVKQFYDAYISLDIKNVEAHISKNYKFQTYPKVDHMPEESKGEHLGMGNPLPNFSPDHRRFSPSRLQLSWKCFLIIYYP